MSAMAASLGANPALFSVQVVRAADGWHRRARLGAFGWWQPEGCPRDSSAEPLEARAEPPAGGVMCRVCWPVWPPVGRSK